METSTHGGNFHLFGAHYILYKINNWTHTHTLVLKTVLLVI